jgi:hypothetical protein
MAGLTGGFGVNIGIGADGPFAIDSFQRDFRVRTLRNGRWTGNVVIRLECFGAEALRFRFRLCESPNVHPPDLARPGSPVQSAKWDLQNKEGLLT